MAPIHPIPKVKCSATAKRTQQPCRSWAVPGTTVCPKHGGSAPQVRRKAERVHTLAQLIRDDPRHPWEVVLNATHIGDSLMRECEAPLRRGEQLTAEQVDRLVESTRLAHHLAKTALDTRAHEHIADSFQRHEHLEADIVSKAIVTVLDKLVSGLFVDDPSLDARTRSALFKRRDEVVQWSVNAAGAALLDGGDDVPEPPLADVTLVLTEDVPGTTNRNRDDHARRDDSGPTTDDVVDAELVDEPGDESEIDPTSPADPDDPLGVPADPAAVTGADVVRLPYNPMRTSVPGWGRRRAENPMTQGVMPWRE